MHAFKIFQGLEMTVNVRRGTTGTLEYSHHKAKVHGRQKVSQFSHHKEVLMHHVTVVNTCVSCYHSSSQDRANLVPQDVRDRDSGNIPQRRNTDVRPAKTVKVERDIL